MNKPRLLLCFSFALALTSLAQEKTADGFSLPQPGRKFEFPRDHGSHPDFRTEWWYLTGHLDSSSGQRFGFQVTFFRQAGKPGQQLYLAHTAISIPSEQRFLHEERLNREGWDASSALEQLSVKNGNWSLVGTNPLLLTATVKADAALQLQLIPEKPLVIFGKDGVSRKGTAPEAASHYLTFPRLGVTGSLRVGTTEHKVTGSAWMDHEFSSSQLDQGQVGWDWASLQLQDGREVMVYRMRRTDGSSDPAGSTFALISKAGTVEHRDLTRFTWTNTQTWTSPRSQATYPIAPRIESAGEVFQLRPLQQDQELDGPITGLAYWEGSCDVLNAQGQVIGRAFLELAGYTGNLSQHLRSK